MFVGAGTPYQKPFIVALGVLSGLILNLDDFCVIVYIIECIFSHASRNANNGPVMCTSQYNSWYVPMTCFSCFILNLDDVFWGERQDTSPRSRCYRLYNCMCYRSCLTFTVTVPIVLPRGFPGACHVGEMILHVARIGYFSALSALGIILPIVKESE